MFQEPTHNIVNCWPERNGKPNGQDMYGLKKLQENVVKIWKFWKTSEKMYPHYWGYFFTANILLLLHLFFDTTNFAVWHQKLCFFTPICLHQNFAFLHQKLCFFTPICLHLKVCFFYTKNFAFLHRFFYTKILLF